MARQPRAGSIAILLLICRKVYFISTHRILHFTSFGTPVVEQWVNQEIAHWGNKKEQDKRKEGYVLLNDTFNTFYLLLFGLGL